ncbi:WS/DGAT domain-containing protein [Streptomyces tremellae]|uniref:O-acyltransferase WSD1 C-terminal domain-containing protein n=1 Tax=Streptomyces tremellae TaxID=1124239 RepID=A0ABP7F701_9ACTN
MAGTQRFPDAALDAYGAAHPGTGLGIGAVLELTGPPPSRAEVAASLRPVAALLGTGDPLGCVEEPAEAAGRGLLDVAGDLVGRALGPRRWSCAQVTGLPGGTFALVWRADHRLLDGAGVAGALAAWAGVPARATAAAPRAGARTGWRVLPADPLRAAWLCARPLLGRRLPGALPAATALSYACAAVPLDTLRDAGRAHGASVNDVYLAALAGALRARPLPGATGRAVRALVPVNVRGATDAAVLHNRHIPLRLDLPVTEPDPARRLALVAARTRGGVRALGHPLVGAVYRALPAAVGGLLVERYFGEGRADLLASNVRGPADPLRVAGRRVLRVLPLNFLPAAHRFSAVLATAQGTAGVGFTVAGPRAEAEALAAAWTAEARLLAAAADQATTGGSSAPPMAPAR